MFNRKSWGLVLGIFLFTSIVLSSYVSAATIFDPIRDMFASWERGDLSVNIAKYAFWILLSLVIYSILDFVPIFAKSVSGIKFSIAFVVAFLSTAYLTTEEIYTILLSYNALGLILGVALPCVILLFFSIQVKKEGGAGGAIFSKVLWIGFMAFLIYKIIYAASFVEGPGNIGWGIAGTYLGFIAFSFLWITVLERQVLKLLFKEEFATITRSNLVDLIARREADIAERDELAKHLTGDILLAHNKRTKELTEQLGDLKKKL